LAVALGVVLSLLAGELVLRLFLFHPKLDVGGLGESIRQPQKYSDGDTEDDYWKLRSGFQDPSLIVDAPNADPITGWTGSFITPGTYAHVNENAIRGRQVVILYGDSYAQCNTPPAECFQAILERSDLARQYVMMNYGVGGYGLDQIYLLLKHSIDRFKDVDPIVIVGILLESDLERSVLSFRDWPKPHLAIVDGSLVLPKPVETDTKKFLAENPVSIKSFLWRFFLFHPAHFMSKLRAKWRTNDRIRAEKEVLNRRILIEIDRELTSRHLRHFFLIFHAEQGALEPWDLFVWQEQLIRDVCAEFSIPLVDTRPYLTFAADNRPVKAAQFYGHSGPLNAHHNAVGNVVCFEAFRQGLRGDFGTPDMQHLAEMKRHGLFDSGDPVRVSMELLGRPATLILHGSTERIRVTETSKPERLILRADVLGPTHAEFDLAGKSKRFTGRVHTMKDSDKDCAGIELDFTVEVDGRVVLEHSVPPASQALDLDIDLADKHTLSLGVRGFGGGAGCEWVCIENPRLE
jgi:hypothetical protein